MSSVAWVVYPHMDELDFVACYAPLAKAASLAGCPFDLVRIGASESIEGSMSLGLSQLPPECTDLNRVSHVLVPGGSGASQELPAQLYLTLRTLQARGTQFYSVCSGAFLLARAGLLEGMRVAVHHDKGDLLRTICSCIPTVGVTRDRWLYSIGGDISSSRCKGLEAGFQVLHELWPEQASRIAQRMEYQPAFPPAAQPASRSTAQPALRPRSLI